MITVTFKAVGQGDSILLEWESGGEKKIGVIDCNVYDGKNPVLDYITTNSIREIEFVILSHFHYDHFSGMPALFKHCIDTGIKVKYFFHQIDAVLFDLYDRFYKSQKLQRTIESFIMTIDAFVNIVKYSIQVHDHVADLKLTNSVSLRFLAPPGKVATEIIHQLSRRRNNQTVTIADINRLATIIMLFDTQKAILLTSDAIKKAFSKVLLNKIENEVVLVQVPHHGSVRNLNQRFWEQLKKKEDCIAIFSVGDEPKDKLPNETTVSFFDKKGFDVRSTASVYGIATYFQMHSISAKNSSQSIALNNFSKLRVTTNNSILSKYSGDQKFHVL